MTKNKTADNNQTETAQSDKRSGKKNHYLRMMIVTAVFFFAMHLTFVGFTNDDSYFVQLRQDWPSLTELLLFRYRTDSSRVLSEAILFTLIRMPFIVWQILDTLICILIAHSASVILVNDKYDKKNYLIFGLFACYPYMHMGSAGWICTSLNYIWPLAAFLYALSCNMRRYRGEKVSGGAIRCGLIALVFAANCEQSATVVIMSFALVLWFMIKEKKSKWFEITALCIGIFGLIFALSAPGNEERTAMEAANWMPEFFDLSIFEKARLCSVFVFEHFVAIPDVIFFLFSLLLLFAGIKKENKLWVRIVSFVPLVTDVIFTSVYFVIDFIIGHKRNYDFSFPSVYMTDAKTVFIQLSEVAGLVIYIAAAVIVLWNVGIDFNEKLISIWCVGVGFAVRMALMLSPTMFASWHRVLIFMYFAFLGDSYLLYKKLDKEWQKYLVYAVIVIGIIANLVLIVGLQIRKAGM